MVRNHQAKAHRPKFGEVYLTLQDIKVLGVSLFKAAGSGGFKCVLPKGTRVVIMHKPMRGASAVSVRPLNYAQLEQCLVPEAERTAPLYNGYGITIYLTDLARHSRREPRAEVVFDSAEAQNAWQLILKHNPPTY